MCDRFVGDQFVLAMSIRCNYVAVSFQSARYMAIRLAGDDPATIPRISPILSMEASMWVATVAVSLSSPFQSLVLVGGCYRHEAEGPGGLTTA